MTARRRALIAGAAALGLLLVLVFWIAGRAAEVTVPGPAPAVTASSGPSGQPVPPSGAVASRSPARPAVTNAARPQAIAACGKLPPEVADAVAAIRANGPYLRPRDDGGRFGNREYVLPLRDSGYYREYTVAAPGQRFPGPRRLVTGGQADLGAEPAIWYYTADHYDSFCELRP